MSKLTPGQLTTVRQPVQSTELYLGIYQPQTVMRGQLKYKTLGMGMFVNGAIYYNLITGSASEIRPNMTAYLGVDDDQYDLGRVRVKNTLGSDGLLIGGDPGIYFRENAYVDVKEFYEFWPVFPRAVLDTGTAIPDSYILYKDYNIPYTDQGTEFIPVPIVGPHYAGFIDPITKMKNVEYNSTQSYTVGDDNITTTNWRYNAHAGQAVYSARNTVIGFDNITATFSGSGFYTIDGEVYADNGRSGTFHRHVALFDRPGTGPNPPVADWEFEGMTGDYQTGWIAKVSIGEEAYKIIDGSLVIIFADDKYNYQTISYGGLAPFSNIVFVGYADNSQTKYNWQTSKTSFVLKGIAGVMRNREMFAMELSSVDVPTDWTEVYRLNVNKIIDHYLRYHSTLLEMTDYTPILTAQGEYGDWREQIAKGEILTAINNFLDQKLSGIFSADKYGRLFSEIDLNMLVTGSRPASVMSITDTDWIQDIVFDEVISTPVSNVLVGGTSLIYETGVTGSYLSRAPTKDFPMTYGKQASKSNMIVQNQAEVNRLAGLFFARENAKYNSLFVELANNMRNIDVIPQEFYDFTLAKSKTGRQTHFTKRFIPRKIDYKHKAGSLLQTVTFDAETYGPAGETVIIPVKPPTGTNTGGGGGDTPPPPGPQEGTLLVYCATRTKIGRTENFLATSPNWENVTGILDPDITTDQDGITDFIVDPFHPSTRAWCTTRKAVWRTINLDASPPTWTKIFDYTDYFGDDGAIHRICSTITAEGHYIVGGHYYQVGIASLARTLITTDNGVTWSVQDSTYGTGRTRTWTAQGVDYSNYTSNIYTTSYIAGGVGVCFDVPRMEVYGQSNYNLSSCSTNPVFDILIPYWKSYQNSTINENDTIYVVTQSFVIRLDNFSPTTITPSGWSGGYGPVGYTGQWLKFPGHIEGDDELLFLVDEQETGSLWRSTDGGANWTKLHNGTLSYPQALGIWSPARDKILLNQMDAPYLSLDMGVTFDNKLGDWNTVMGETFQYPVQLVNTW